MAEKLSKDRVRMLMEQLGSIGGRAAAKGRTAAERKALAKKAARARWGKAKKSK